MTNSENLSNWVADQIRDQEPGFAFPSVNALADSFKVSAVTVNRILGRLAKEGKLMRVPGKGTFLPGGKTEPAPVSGKIISSVTAITDAVLGSIAAGELKKGDALPQLTFMAIKFKVAYKTVIQAYRELAKTGEVTQVGKTFWVGTFKDTIRQGVHQQIYIFIHNKEDFSGLYRSNLRYAYRKMEKELNSHGYKILYATTARLRELLREWIRTRSAPAGILFSNLTRFSGGEVVDILKKYLPRLGNEVPRVLFDSASLKLKRNAVPAPHHVLARGHITTMAVRSMIDYIAEHQYRKAYIFMDEGADSWVVLGIYFALFRLAWELYDKKGISRLRYVIRPLEDTDVKDLRTNRVPGRLKGNARRTMNKDEQEYADKTARETIVTASFKLTYKELYEPGVLWIFNRDEDAVAALSWAEQEKIKVPDELSVIGLDHKPEYFHLGLSYCGPDWDTIGYQMAHALIGDMPIARTGKGFIRTRADMFRKITSR